MAFNKLQGFTLLVSFLVICLLNAKSYDFAESEAAVFEAVNDMMDGDMASEAAVEQATKRLMNYLPKMQQLKDPKILGAIAAVVVASILGVVYYKTRTIADWPKHVTELMDKRLAKDVDSKLPEEEKNKVKAAREELKGKITAQLADSDFKPNDEKAAEWMKKVYAAQKECGVKAPELLAVLKDIAKHKEVKYDDKVEYLKTLKEGIAKADTKATEETKKFVPDLEAEFKTFVDKANATIEARKLVEAYVKVLSMNDKDMITVDLNAKPEDMKKGSKK